MCCDACPKYYKCEERDMLTENCCKRCLDYKHCQDIGTDMCTSNEEYNKGFNN